MQMLLQLENSKDKVELVEEDKQLVLVYLFLQDNFYKTTLLQKN